jgi:hypothetical protein
MSYDLIWFKELDGVYLEIWRRVSQEMVRALHSLYTNLLQN